MSGYSKNVKFLTPDQIQSLLDHSFYTLRNGEFNCTGPRDYLLIDMGFYHGFRISELLALNWEDIDLEYGTVQFTRSKSGIRSLHNLTPDQLKWLKGISDSSFPDPKSPIFRSRKGKRLSRRSALEMIKKCAKRAGLPEWVGCHTLRHSCGFWLDSMGMPIQSIAKWLGHADIRNTMIYTDAPLTNLPFENPLNFSKGPRFDAEVALFTPPEPTQKRRKTAQKNRKGTQKSQKYPLPTTNIAQKNHTTAEALSPLRNFYGTFVRSFT